MGGEPQDVAVLGMGAFGTALAALAVRNGHRVKAFARDPAQREAIITTRRNPKALSDAELPEALQVAASVEEACAGAQIVLLALPSQSVPPFIREHRSAIPADAILCSTAKGLFLEDKCLLSEAMASAFGRPQPTVVLSGPSFARHVMEEQPTVVVAASAELPHAVTVQHALASPSFRVYASDDLIGVELGGALKNPLAIAAGMLQGADYGINTTAAYLTRACRELKMLCTEMGGKPETVNGLSGIGDLMLTAFGELSRNRQCGVRLVRGEALDDILASATVEGVPTAATAVHFATSRGLELPIFETVSRVLDGSLPKGQAKELLMLRPLGVEVASGSPSAPGRERGGPQKVACIGMGAFGTAMAVLAARSGHEVRAFVRNAEQREAINTTHRNPKAKTLEQLDLPENIVAVPTMEEACAGASIVLHCLPAQGTPAFIREHRAVIPAEAIFCSTAKGLYLADKCLLSEAMMAAFDRPQPLAVLSGPSFAKQIVERHPTVVVVASKELDHAVTVQYALSDPDFRIYASDDLCGVELGGSLKNPLAIGAGMIEGAKLGINTMAAYLTRACRELQLLCTAMGGRPETVNGLSGIGDLMLTAFGELSRNRTCGMRLAQGEALQDILAASTVEGVPTAGVAMHFAREANLELPIFEAVSGILDGTVDAKAATKLLMGRPLGTEAGRHAAQAA